MTTESNPTSPPVVPIANHKPMLDYFHDGCGNYWGVARLQELAKDLPVFDLPLAALELAMVPTQADSTLPSGLPVLQVAQR